MPNFLDPIDFIKRGRIQITHDGVTGPEPIVDIYGEKAGLPVVGEPFDFGYGIFPE